jgi:hypothetical protein
MIFSSEHKTKAFRLMDGRFSQLKSEKGVGPGGEVVQATGLRTAPFGLLLCTLFRSARSEQ